LSDDPEFAQRFRQWGEVRQQNYQQRQQQLQAGLAGEKPDLEALWNRQYAKGSGSETSEQKHQTIFHCQPVIDQRKP